MLKNGITCRKIPIRSKIRAEITFHGFLKLAIVKIELILDPIGIFRYLIPFFHIEIDFLQFLSSGQLKIPLDGVFVDFRWLFWRFTKKGHVGRISKLVSFDSFGSLK